MSDGHIVFNDNVMECVTPNGTLYIEHAITSPDYKSSLQIIEGFVLQLAREKPNAWWRFWQYVLLGFKWME